MPTINSHVLRLKPGDDLRESIQRYVDLHKITAGWVTTCAGSLATYNIRFANQQEGHSEDGHFEIVSLSGTLSSNGSHLHISVSDTSGRVTGGHLLAGNKVYTTAEVVIQSSTEFLFTRETDSATGFRELHIEKR